METRAATAYLKGIAILCVVALHYAGVYAGSYIPGDLDLYVAQVVYFFFVLSGYGLYYSLEKSFGGGRSLAASLLSFYGRRAARIYPLYWLALLSAPLLLKGLPDTWEFTAHNVGLYLAVPWQRGESYLWFISALMQCYLVAPLLFLILRKARPVKFLWGLFLLTDLLIFLSVFVSHGGLTFLPELRQSSALMGYLLFENLLLFAAGLALPMLIAAHSGLIRKTAPIGLPASLALAGASAYLTMNPDIFFNNSQPYYALVAVICIPLICAYVIGAGSPKIMPLQKLVCLAGAYSFALYLFHPHYFAVLGRLGLATGGSISVSSVIYTIATFPLFVIFCVLLEKSVNGSVRKLSQRPMWSGGVLARTSGGSVLEPAREEEVL